MHKNSDFTVNDSFVHSLLYDGLTIFTSGLICWLYHLRRWPPFVSLQYYGIAFLMRGITELQDLLGVIAD